jgi:alkylation response protein AidB-like acyl-CoA dehydrogenase
MAKYYSDLEDIHFNLFEMIKVQDHSKEYSESDIKDIIRELDKFIEKEIFPIRQQLDVDGVKLENGSVTVPEYLKTAYKSFYENGWFGLGYPEEIGGMPAPNAVNLACTSMVTGSNVSFSMYFGLTRAAMNVILKIGTDEQKKKYIAKIMEGAWGGTMCLTESNAGSDVGALKTTATPVSEGKYKISGSKIFISSGDSDIYENNIHLVLARTPGAAEGSKGVTLFIVPKLKFNDDGSLGDSNNVICSKIEEKMGLHGSSTCELLFGEGGECIGEMIGAENEGMANMFLMMNEARLLCGMQGESQGNLVYELTLQYARERSQFGNEIINHPDIRRMLLKMRAMGRGLRALNLYTASQFDLNSDENSDHEEEIGLLTPVCKSYATDMGFNMSIDAIQILGGYGYCQEYGIEQFARDIKIASIYEGTNGIQSIDFVMRKILKDRGAAFQKLGAKMRSLMKTKEAEQWKEEVAEIRKSMQAADSILAHYAALMQDKNINIVLGTCTDFLLYCGNLFTAWLLLGHAREASIKSADAEGEKLKYYQSKIVDFKIFCHHYLVNNAAIARTILDYEEDLTRIEL